MTEGYTPEFKHSLPPKTFYSDQSKLIFNCESFAKPHPSIKWFSNGKHLVVNEEEGFHNGTSNGLVFQFGEKNAALVGCCVYELQHMNFKKIARIISETSLIKIHGKQ